MYYVLKKKNKRLITKTANYFVKVLHYDTLILYKQKQPYYFMESQILTPENEN